MKTECRFATAETLDNHNIKIVSKKQPDKVVMITEDDEIVSLGFDVARFYTWTTGEATNEFTVNYTVKLSDGRYQHCKYWLDRTTFEPTTINPTKGKPFRKHLII